MSLTRKKITVRTKRGKTFQRSVLVKEVTKPKRYLAPGAFIARHKNQFVGMFALGVAQGAAAHTAARMAHKRYGKLAGAASGAGAYIGVEKAGTAVWKRAMGRKYDTINQDFARLAPHTEAAMSRVFHGVGYAGNVVGAAGAWATHRLMNRSRR